MINLKTDPALLAKMRAARPMTPAEIAEQRVSWVFGQLGHRNALSKQEVREILNRVDGR